MSVIPGIGPCYLPGETPAPAAHHMGTLRHSFGVPNISSINSPLPPSAQVGLLFNGPHGQKMLGREGQGHHIGGHLKNHRIVPREDGWGDSL